MSKTLALFLKSSIEAIKDAGIKDIVLSPGSRSTPLAILLEQDKDLAVYMDVDERSAAFFALGLAKVSRKPVVCVCTSGTAAANYFPAICEAMESQIPLVILTTDRPHELRHVGAPQTMEQVHLYGDKVKFSMEFPIAEASESMLQYSYSQMFQLITRGKAIPQGPVHANFPFREPLIPDLSQELPEIKRKKIYSGSKVLPELDSSLVETMSQKKGWFIIGEMTEPLDIQALIALAEKLDWPIFSDPLANIKTSGYLSENFIDHHDLLMKHTIINQENIPEVIVRIGRALLSKSLNQFLTNFSGDYLLIDESGMIPDYSHQVSAVIDTNANSWLQQAIKAISENKKGWLMLWQDLDKQISTRLKLTEALTDYSEIKITKDILENLPKNSQLFISNSLPIRDIDTVLTTTDKHFSLFGTRGINGIDGIISSAFGMTANQPNVWNGLIIGDISFFHSMNGLALGKQNQLLLTIFVINNDGGGIFSMLPQGALPKELFETLFGTPQSINIEAIAQGFNCEYQKVTNLDEWTDVSQRIFKQPAFRIVEIITSREKNTQLRQEMNQQIGRGLA